MEVHSLVLRAVPRDFPGYVNLAGVVRIGRQSACAREALLYFTASTQSMGFCLSGRSASDVLCSFPFLSVDLRQWRCEVDPRLLESP